jgi:hypothetical protein
VAHADWYGLQIGVRQTQSCSLDNMPVFCDRKKNEGRSKGWEQAIRLRDARKEMSSDVNTALVSWPAITFYERYVTDKTLTEVNCIAERVLFSSYSEIYEARCVTCCLCCIMQGNVIGRSTESERAMTQAISNR